MLPALCRATKYIFLKLNKSSNEEENLFVLQALNVTAKYINCEVWRVAYKGGGGVMYCMQVC